jgi:hypothetical protein
MMATYGLLFLCLGGRSDAVCGHDVLVHPGEAHHAQPHGLQADVPVVRLQDQTQLLQVTHLHRIDQCKGVDNKLTSLGPWDYL